MRMYGMKVRILPREVSRTCGRFFCGCHDALRKSQFHINSGYKYVVDLDLEKFFDTVSHSRLIEILSRTIEGWSGHLPNS